MQEVLSQYRTAEEASYLWQTKDEVSTGSDAIMGTQISLFPPYSVSPCLLDTEKPSLTLHAARATRVPGLCM